MARPAAWAPPRRPQLRAFVNAREGLGLGGDADYERLTNDRWYFHDCTMLHNHTLTGVGASWALSAVAMRLIDAESIDNIRFARKVEIARHFDSDGD